MVDEEIEDLDDVWPWDEVQDFKEIDESRNNEVYVYLTQGIIKKKAPSLIRP